MTTQPISSRVSGSNRPASLTRLARASAATGVLAGAIGVVATQAATAQEGRTVWDGIYTEQQATRGETVYQAECTFCHLDDLQGDAFATPLIEDAFTVRWVGARVDDLLTVVQVTMPADRPNTLPDQAVADVVAFLLKMNEYPAGEQELPARPTALGDVIFTPQ